LYQGSPPGSLDITASPSPGTVLHPGDEVEVTATWTTTDWPTAVLHKVLDCLLVDGSVDYGHSSQEKPTDNDGLYRYRFTVPPGPPPPAPPQETTPAVAAVPTRPRTGADVLPLAGLGALLVVLGGAALAGRATVSRSAASRPLPAPAASGVGAGPAA